MVIGNIIIYSSIFFFLYISILSLLVLWECKNRIYKPKLRKNHPNVCIIVPCFNEEKTIVKTVHSLLKLDYPRNRLEILVIDDGSSDKTLERAKTLEKYTQVKVFHKPNKGKYTALNYGLSKTKAEFVGCLDADSFVISQALGLIMPYFNNPKIMACTSSVKIHQAKGALQRIQKIEYIFGIFLRKVFALLNSITVAPGPFTIFRKRAFDKLGPFRHGHNTEDLEIAFRIQSKNYEIANAPNACVYTVGPSSFKKLFQQRKRWYSGLSRNAWDYRSLMFNRTYGDLGFFVFPSIFLSVLIFLFVSFYAIFQFTQYAIHRFIVWQAVGFNLNQFVFRFDWFFINTQLYVLLSVLLFGISFSIVLLGKKLSFTKSKIGKDFLFFVLFYSPLYFIWWLSAIQDIVFNKKNKW